MEYQDAQATINSGVSAREHVKAMKRMETVFP